MRLMGPTSSPLKTGGRNPALAREARWQSRDRTRVSARENSDLSMSPNLFNLHRGKGGLE